MSSPLAGDYLAAVRRQKIKQWQQNQSVNIALAIDLYQQQHCLLHDNVVIEVGETYTLDADGFEMILVSQIVETGLLQLDIELRGALSSDQSFSSDQSLQQRLMLSPQRQCQSHFADDEQMWLSVLAKPLP
ncbi:hypothetical protein [Shewanella waksmanii]|uniref:hypothetical protein n=1 Tax=Shewanella waksmanii TaxID=213783 RepID=UPI003735820A